MESCVKTKIDRRFISAAMRSGVARVVGERQERPDVRNEAAMQREAVGDRRHREFAHAVVDVVARLLRA